MNPYFELESPRSLAGWTRLAALTDPDLLRARVEAARAALGDGPLRAAASVDFLGLAARVISPWLASRASTGRAPALTLQTVWWRARVPGPMRLAFTAAGTATELETAVVEPVLRPLVETYATVFTLSRKVLWGNVASARNGAELALGLRRAGAMRETCCLIYRFPDMGICGDCVLRRRARTSDVQSR